MASATTTEQARPKAAAAVRAFPKTTVAGFTVEEVAPGVGTAEARKGQTALLKVQLRLAKDAKRKGEPPVRERGEFSCRLGESEVLDGWVDGSVDMEEVLASWGSSLVGMRVGGRRRVHIPGPRSFKDGAGGDIPDGAAVLFDVELKKLD